MSLPAVLQGNLSLPVICSPLFIISNPDLVARLKADAPLAEGDQATFYGGGDKGFTDYPTLELQAAE